MDMQLTPSERHIMETVRQFARDHIAPAAAGWEAERRPPIEVFRLAADAGLCGLLAPADSGGSNLRLTAAIQIAEVLAGACMAFTFGLWVHNNLIASLARNGSPAQRARYLRDMIEGRRFGAFLLTEPDAGSDAAAISTRAVRNGDGWAIDGRKAWVSNGAFADLLCVYAQTDPDQGWRGIAAFLVEADSPGVERGEPYTMMGGHALGVSDMTFRNCRVSDDAFFLPPETAFKGAMAGINSARIAVGAMCCGMMECALAEALDYAAERRAFGQALLDFQGLQWMLAEVATEIEASRLLTAHAAAAYDRGETAMLEAAHAKKFASRAALKGLSDCMQVMGAAGYRADRPLARHLACAKMTQFLDGASEIQNLVIARELIRRRAEKK
jgi:alkylation response protein AidB-like acyl-CoA dehydrogenase